MDRVGPPSPSSAISSIRRNSAATTKCIGLRPPDRRAGLETRDKIRFWESNGGAGPRATPTLSEGRVYALGATGVVNASMPPPAPVVVAQCGQGGRREDPGLEISGSPLVVDELVIAAAGGILAVYDSGPASPLGRAGGRRRLQLAASRDDRRRPAGPLHQRARHDECRSEDGKDALAARLGRRGDRAAGADADGGMIVDAIRAAAWGSGGSASRERRWTAAERWTSTGLKP